MHECRGRRDAQERLSWAQRLKRVFRIEIEQCERCGGRVRVIASVEDPAVIGKILAHDAIFQLAGTGHCGAEEAISGYAPVAARNSDAPAN